jgi:acetyltransferase-like isoleucine patch superfamily enzyme
MANALAARAGSLRSIRATALHVDADRRAPAPRAFARFGAGSWIVPPTRVHGAGRIAVGRDVVILEHGELIAAAPIAVGDGARFGRFVVVSSAAGVVIGDDVMASDCVAIVDGWGPPTGGWPGGLPPPVPTPVVVEAGAYLGAGCVIGPGVRVGAGAYVGEGAVVTDDVPAHAVVFGNPAAVVRSWSADAGEWRAGDSRVR